MALSSNGGRKLILHTTETQRGTELPLSTAPHNQPRGTGQDLAARQRHRGAYALKSAPQSPNYEAGVVYQVEHIAYAKDTPNQSDLWYHSLAREIVWFHRNKDVPLVFVPVWEDGGLRQLVGADVRSRVQSVHRDMRSPACQRQRPLGPRRVGHPPVDG